MNIEKYIGRQVTKIRKQNNLSQQELAQEVDYDTSTISLLESGKFRVPIQKLQEIAQYFSVPISYFLPDTNQEKIPVHLSLIEEQVKELTQLLRQELHQVKNRAWYVSVTGNIGTGKAEITRFLAREFDGQAFGENAANNPYLANYYQQPEQYAFKSQLFFLTENFKQQSAINETNVPVFQGRTIFENYHIFAKLLRKLDYLSKEEFELIERFYQTSRQMVRVPDLVIYLDESVENLSKKVMEQGHYNYSEFPLKDYLAAMDQQYQQWLERYTLSSIITYQLDSRQTQTEISRNIFEIVKDFYSQN